MMMEEVVISQEKDKLLFSFYIFGERYYEYIPLCLYFIGKSHPEAWTVITCRDRLLPPKIAGLLLSLSNQRFRIDTDKFRYFPNSPNILKMARWLMMPKEYDHFDYVYIGDIDLFVTDDDLLNEHLSICNQYNIPYSNTDKIDRPVNIRFTGLHFFKSKEYLKAMKPVMKFYDSWLSSDQRPPQRFYNIHQHRYDNQKALREMVKDSGLPMPTHKFFKYHGLHLGHSRCEGRWQMLFSCHDDEHVKYYRQFQGFIDDEYKRLYNLASDTVKAELDIMTNGFQEVYQNIL